MPVLRKRWLAALVRQVQTFAGDSLTYPPRGQVRIARRFLRNLPKPKSVVEEQIVRVTLLDTAKQWEAQMAAVGLRWRRSRLKRMAAERFAGGPKAAAAAFLEVVESGSRLVGLEAAAGAATVLTAGAPRQRLAALAANHRVHAATLRRAFRRTFGISMRDFRRRQRVLRAIPLLAEAAKISAVAEKLGYRSVKNFYRDVRAETGLTPARLRSLSSEARQKLVRNLSKHRER